MKKILILMAMCSFSAFAACTDVNGTYDLPSMKTYCSSDRDYIPGDDSPFSTILPSYFSEYPLGNNGTPGYVEANKKLLIEVSKDCKSLKITINNKESVITPRAAVEVMKFNVKSFEKGVLTIQSKSKSGYTCDMGICGTLNEIRTLTLKKVGEEVILDSKIKSSGVIYAVPYSKSENSLTCRFHK